MTAAHVVASAADPRAPHAAADIELIFGNPDGQTLTVSGAKVGNYFDPDADWAVLELPAGAQLHPDAKPFRLREPAFQDELPWDTFGYSNLFPDQGLKYGGTIATDSALFQLRVEATQGDPSGLSGSPCLVDGEVVGIVLNAPGKQVTDTLLARSMATIRQAGYPEAVVLPRSAPYASYVERRIRPFETALCATAAALGLASDRHEAEKIFVKARLPGRVALAMMSGPEATLTGIRSMKGELSALKDEAPVDVARDLLERAVRVWIDTATVRQLRQALDAGRHVILNTDNARVVPWYLHRLTSLDDVNDPSRYERSFFVDPATPAHDVVLQAFAEVVSQELGDGQLSAATLLADHFHDDEPIVAWFRGLPERKTIDALRGLGPGYDQVRLLFMVGLQSPAQVAAEYPDAVVLTPPPLPNDVDRALGALENGLKRVRQWFQVKGSAA